MPTRIHTDQFSAKIGSTVPHCNSDTVTSTPRRPRSLSIASQTHTGGASQSLYTPLRSPLREHPQEEATPRTACSPGKANQRQNKAIRFQILAQSQTTQVQHANTTPPLQENGKSFGA